MQQQARYIRCPFSDMQVWSSPTIVCLIKLRLVPRYVRSDAKKWSMQVKRLWAGIDRSLSATWSRVGSSWETIHWFRGRECTSGSPFCHSHTNTGMRCQLTISCARVGPPLRVTVKSISSSWQIKQCFDVLGIIVHKEFLILGRCGREWRRGVAWRGRELQGRERKRWKI